MLTNQQQLQTLHQALLTGAGQVQGQGANGQQQAAPAVTERRIKLKEWTDQLTEDECLQMTAVEYARCQAVYEAVYGKDERPPEGEDVTIEQMSAVRYLLNADPNPTVDFNILGPYGHRTVRRVKLIGQFMGNDGNYHKIEILGPATFDMWLAAWNVYQHCLMMLEAVELGRLVNYRRHQERL